MWVSLSSSYLELSGLFRSECLFLSPSKEVFSHYFFQEALSPFLSPRLLELLQCECRLLDDSLVPYTIFTFFFILFSFCCFDWVGLWVTAPLFYCWSPLVYFFGSATVFFSSVTSIWNFLLFSFSSVWSSYCIRTIILNSLSSKVLVSFFINFFPDILSFSSFGTYFCVSSFCLTLCIGFNELVETTTSFSLDRLGLCRNWTLFDPALFDLGCLSNLCDCPISLLYF